MTFGLTSAGFVPKTLTDLKSDMETYLKSKKGASINLLARSNISQFVGAVADRLAELWEIAQATNASVDPDFSAGAALVSLCALTGTVPRAATHSTLTLVATGTAGTVLPSGRTASVLVTGSRFDTTALGTLAAATAWASGTVYTLGTIRTNGGNIYVVITAGTSAGSGGPTGTALDITDNTCHWKFVGSGAAYALIPAQAENTGPVIAATGTLATIETPVFGWTSVNNLADALLGLDTETDAELKIRREAELLGNSASVLDAIRVHLSRVTGVLSAIVFQNDSESTDGDGLPPHAVECLVRGGADADITAAVFANVGAGNGTYGNQSHTVTAVANGSQVYTVKWSRPNTQNVYVIANLIKDVAAYPLDGDAQVAAAILAFGAGFATGKDVTASGLIAQCFKVAGVLDVTSLYIGLAPAPGSSATLPMALRDLAVFDSARVTVNSSSGTP